MAAEPPIYDLVLLLDSQADDERRDEIAGNVQQAIESDGELVGRHDWGVRATAFEVRKRTDADYRLIQFRGPPALLERLNHTLKITDGVVRFRIIKLRPGTPPPPDLSPSAAPAAAAPAADES
jgi:small subunit ribosomal protein S6